MPEKPRILVVDDESQITRVLRTSLSTHGYDVRIANDGEAGFTLFQEWNPDLVITDLSMPKMTGIELCENIRDHSQAPIIILSVKGEDKIKIDALDKGADDTLPSHSASMNYWPGSGPICAAATWPKNLNQPSNSHWRFSYRPPDADRVGEWQGSPPHA